jgi:uncharacterized protein YukE
VTAAAEGMPLAQDVEALSQSIKSGSWGAGLEAGVTTGLDVLGTITNPVDSLLTSGISWLMEHVHVFTEILDSLAGNPAAIQAYADHWTQRSQQLTDIALDLRNHVANDTNAWTGEAADTYRAQAAQQVDGIHAAAASADSVAAAVQGAGQLVASVRMLVRDLIAQAVAEIIEHIPVWLAAEGCSLGLATPGVIADAVALIAKWM